MKCSHCDQQVHESLIVETKHWQTVCPTCIEHYTKCLWCKELVNKDQIEVDHAGDDVCTTCIGEDFTKCCGCNQYFETVDTFVDFREMNPVCESCKPGSKSFYRNL